MWLSRAEVILLGLSPSCRCEQQALDGAGTMQLGRSGFALPNDEPDLLELRKALWMLPGPVGYVRSVTGNRL